MNSICNDHNQPVDTIDNITELTRLANVVVVTQGVMCLEQLRNANQHSVKPIPPVSTTEAQLLVSPTIFEVTAFCEICIIKHIPHVLMQEVNQIKVYESLLMSLRGG
jgi:hypothetical protein